MAIDFTTNPEGLFPRLGRIGKLLYTANGHQSALVTQFGALQNQYDSTLQDIYGPTARSSLMIVRSQTAWYGVMALLARETLMEMVRLDQPAVPRTLADALTEVRRQMIAANHTVKACTVSATAVAMSGMIGNGTLVLSTKRGDGLVQENLFAETGRLTCVTDSYSGGAIAGQEIFRYLGEGSENASVFDWDWPQGSGASTVLRVISPDDGGTKSGNLVENGNFETWSGAPLAAGNWTLTTGTWGTHAIRDATAYQGSYAMRLVAGSTLTQFHQDITTLMDTQLSHAVHFQARKLSGTITAGVLTVELVDSTGAIINDQQGVANRFTVDLTALTTTYESFSGVFRLPQVKPSAVRLQFRLSTALTGGDVLVDHLSMGRLTALYTGGPGAAIFAGTSHFLAGDAWQVTGTNDRGGASYLATWQAFFDRVFGMRQLGLLLPSSASPTVSDTLITS